MLCLKKLIIGSGILLPALLSVLFVSPSYAVSDVTFIMNNSNTNNGFQSICSGNCSDYNYLLVDFSNLGDPSSSYWSDFNIRFIYGSQYRDVYSYPFFQSKILYELTGQETDLSFVTRNFSNWFSSGWYYTVTLSENNPISPSCPEPEEPEPCPVIPDTPYGDQLNNITIAIYTCGGILLVLYFFYCIYRIIIKNSGVSNL